VTDEARLEDVGSGLAPVTAGWFVVNVAEAAWLTNDAFGARCVFEADRPVLRGRPDLEPQRFTDLGITLAVLDPGKPSGMYHAESNQEDFLVLAGGCYPSSDPARSRGAGVEGETSSASEAYAPFPHWQPGRPAGWDRLPWAEPG
jgi:hypothetical protein